VEEAFSTYKTHSKIVPLKLKAVSLWNVRPTFETTELRAFSHGCDQ